MVTIRFEFEEILIDTETHEVKVCDDSISLTRKEYELLLYFLANKNRVSDQTVHCRTFVGRANGYV